MRSSKVVAILAIPVLMLPVWGVMAASPAVAEDSCTTTVIDQAGKFTNKTAVENAANKLASDTGAVVYVRTVQNPGASLDKWANDQLAACQNWQSPNGHTPVSFQNTAKENLLVFAMSMSTKEVSIYYGGAWKTPLTQHGDATRIQTTTMGNKFKTGDFSGGFVAGIEETDRIITAYQHPTTGSGGTVMNTPPDLSGLWTFLKWLLLALVAAAAIFGIIWLVRSYVARRNEWMEARQQALSARDAVTTALGKLDDNQRRSIRDAQVKLLSGITTYATKVAKLAKIVKLGQENTVAALTRASSAVGRADDKGLTPVLYNDMAARYDEADGHVQEAVKADAEIADMYDQLQSDINGATDAANRLGNDLETIEGSLADLTASGLKVEGISKLVADARASIGGTQMYAGQPEVLTALAKSKSDVKEAQDAYDTFVATRKQGQDGIADLEKRVNAYPATRENALQCFKRISDGFNEESWKPVRGNGTQSERSADKAAAMLAAAKDAFNAQEWEKAAAEVEIGASSMDRAEGLLSSIIEIEQNLTKAQSELPRVVERVKNVIATANMYIGQHDNDISDSLWDDLKKAQHLLDEVVAAQEEVKPRWLTNLKKALEAETLVKATYDEAVGEYEAAEHLREQAASTLSAAEKEVDRADRYIKDHKSDVEHGAKDAMKDAQASLASAQQASDPQKVYDYASSALEYAKSAYKKAKNDVSDAEGERRETERRSYSSGYGSSYSSTYINTGSNSGSSSSFGGFASGGGSSSSFGGFAGGGGSASGW